MEEDDEGRALEEGSAVSFMFFRIRDYGEESLSCSMIRHPTQEEHPFTSPHASYSRLLSSPQDDEDVKRKEFVDPLGESNMQGNQIVRPFLRPSHLEAPMMMTAFEKKKEDASSDWNQFKVSILQRYASTGTITVSAHFDIVSKDPKGKVKSLAATHLEELEDYQMEVKKETKTISQQEYVTRLRELNDEIAQAWMNNERVGALRLSIKVAKLLSDTSVPQFYPTLFVLVTDVMDTVGNLVWNRIKSKAEMDEDGHLVSSLPERFTADQVRKEAKDTCSNWFYKIGSIHELLPRIYLEIAILHCMQFLENGPPKAAFRRLTMMLRGLADPLSAAYARLYLVRKGQAIIPSEIGFLIVALDDYLLLFQRVLSGDFDKTLTKAGLDLRAYVSLVEPVFDWILQCIFKHANLEEMAFFIRTFGDHESGVNNKKGANPVSMVIHFLLKHLPATAVAAHALELSRIIRNSDAHSMPHYLNYRLLGSRLCECSPPREERLTVLNDVWKVVTRYTNLVEYLTVANVFVEYILQNCSDAELNVFLNEVMKHLRKMEVTQAVLVILESFIYKLMTFSTNLECILALPYFRNILDVFYGDTRISVYKHIANFLSRNNSIVCDPMTRHFMFELCKSLHDSLDSMSSEDDQKQIDRSVSRFVQMVDFGPDLDQHLSFLVDCRGAFLKMDMLKESLVHSSNRLAVSTSKMFRGSHSKDSLNFVKACITFNEITLPSIKNLIRRAHLYLETAEVALMNALLSHVDGLIKSVISVLQEFHEVNNQTSEDDCISFIRKLCSFLVLVPGHPDLGAFYLLRGLINLLRNQPWMQGQQRVQSLCVVLILCSTLFQERLPYHVSNSEVISNDELFNGEMSYHEELLRLAREVVKNLHALIKHESQMQGVQALDACNQLLLAFVVKDDELNELCTFLIQKSISSLPKHNAYLKSTMAFAESRGLKIQSR